MRLRKSEIEKMQAKKPEKKEVVAVGTAEILAAIKDIKLEPVAPIIVEQKIPDEILEQQRAMLEKLSEVSVVPDYPSYHFEVNRTSEGFIKSVDATPTKVDNAEVRNVVESWYK